MRWRGGIGCLGGLQGNEAADELPNAVFKEEGGHKENPFELFRVLSEESLYIVRGCDLGVCNEGPKVGLQFPAALAAEQSLGFTGNLAKVFGLVGPVKRPRQPSRNGQTVRLVYMQNEMGQLVKGGKNNIAVRLIEADDNGAGLRVSETKDTAGQPADIFELHPMVFGEATKGRCNALVHFSWECFLARSWAMFRTAAISSPVRGASERRSTRALSFLRTFDNTESCSPAASKSRPRGWMSKTSSRRVIIPMAGTPRSPFKSRDR